MNNLILLSHQKNTNKKTVLRIDESFIIIVILVNIGFKVSQYVNINKKLTAGKNEPLATKKVNFYLPKTTNVRYI